MAFLWLSLVVAVATCMTYCYSVPIVSEQLDMKPVDITNEKGSPQKVLQHLVKMREYECGTPVPKVIAVSSIYPAVHKRYTPHCVLLHRCENDTGCCNQNGATCGPESEEIVHLDLWVSEMRQGKEKEKRIMNMAFRNHTSCECISPENTPR